MTNFILVVDDDDLTRMQLRDLLEQAGYRVAEARDGEQALAMYTKLQPYLVLQDIVIPRIDGKQAEETLEAYANRQAVVAELSQMALAGTDLSTLMDSSVSSIAQSLNVEYCKVLELLPDGDTLLLRAGVGWQQGLVGCATVSASMNSQAGYTLLSHEPVIVSDLPTEKRFQGPKLLDDHQVVSGISVVIHGKESPFGVLGAHTTRSHTFSKDDIYFLQAIANLLATAIERQRVEDALRESEERFQIIARATNNAVWDWNLLTNQMWWNDGVYKLFGYSQEEVGDYVDWWFQYIHPDNRSRIVSDIHAVINSGEQFWSNEYRFRRSDDSYAYIFERGYVVHDNTGKPVRMIGAMMDISERKRVQQELQRQNLRSKLFADVTLKIRQSLQIDEILQTSVTEVQKLLNADRVLIFRLHSDGSGTVVKEAVVSGFPAIVGHKFVDTCFIKEYMPKYLQGRISAITDIKQANIEPCHQEFLQQFGVQANLVVPILQTNKLWGLLIAHQCNSPRLWTSWETELLRQLADQIAIGLAQAKMLEQETRQKQELTRSNEELQQFAFIASHDLQEPLRKIKTFGDRLKATYGDTLTEQARDYLDRMQNAVRRMQALIEDLLALSRVTTRAQPFVSVNLTQVAQEVLSDLEVLVQQTKGSVEVGDLPTIKADPLQMRQLLQNLIGNALKFHRQQEPPIVKIYSQTIKGENGSELCRIIVEDNGIGFDEKYLERIFNVFQRLHGRSEYEGTGIGLAICRKIAERHQGSITAKSQPRQGSSFIVTMPINSVS